MRLKKGKVQGKSTVALLIAVMMVFALFLAACSSKKETAPTDEPAATAAPATPEPTEVPVVHDPVTIIFVASNPADDPVMKGFREAFMAKHPWITIDHQQAAEFSDKSVLEKVAALHAAGTPADVAVMGDLTLGLKDGLFEDLNPFGQVDADFQSYKFVDGILEGFSINGKLYGMPYGNAPFFTFVNKDLLAKYGMEMPKNDWTYDDFRTMAKNATNTGAGDWGIDGAFWTAVALPTVYTVANGSSPNIYYLNAELNQSIANSPEVVKDLQWVKDLVEKDKVMPSAKAAADLGLKDPFTEGKALFSVGGIWNIRGYKDAVKFNWDIMPMPKGNAKQATFKFVASLVMLTSSKHKDEAFKFLSFFGSTEIGKVNIDQGGTPWVINEDLNNYLMSNAVYAGKNIEAIKLSGALCCSVKGSGVPGFGDYNNGIYGWVPSIITGGADILATVGPAVEKFNKENADGRAALGIK